MPPVRKHYKQRPNASQVLPYWERSLSLHQRTHPHPPLPRWSRRVRPSIEATDKNPRRPHSQNYAKASQTTPNSGSRQTSSSRLRDRPNTSKGRAQVRCGPAFARTDHSKATQHSAYQSHAEVEAEKQDSTQPSAQPPCSAPSSHKSLEWEINTSPCCP
jgi:hypothetical protein